MPNRRLSDALGVLAAGRQPEDVVIAAMSSAFLLATVSKSDRDLAYVAPMGSAGPLGLGLALARPDLRVIVIDGDGSVLMNLGALATIGGLAPGNLVHIVIDNGGYAITGGQPLPGRGPEQLLAFARAAGYASVTHLQGETWTAESILSEPGPAFTLISVVGEYDRTGTAALTHSPQALRTQGPAGYANLRTALRG